MVFAERFTKSTRITVRPIGRSIVPNRTALKANVTKVTRKKYRRLQFNYRSFAKATVETIGNIKFGVSQHFRELENFGLIYFITFLFFKLYSSFMLIKCPCLCIRNCAITLNADTKQPFSKFSISNRSDRNRSKSWNINFAYDDEFKNGLTRAFSLYVRGICVLT